MGIEGFSFNLKVDFMNYKLFLNVQCIDSIVSTYTCALAEN